MSVGGTLTTRAVPRGCSWQGSLASLAGLVVHEDNHLLALFKPGGVLSQADQTRDPCLLSAAKQFLVRKYSKRGDAYVGLVHRLDRPCSGVMVFAKTSKAAARLSEAFRERRVVKKYLAVVEGALAPEGRLEDRLQQHSRLNKAVVQPGVSTNAVEGVLKYRVLREFGEETKSLLDVSLSTGRKHQIRAQLAHHGHPIVGDLKYGSSVRFTHRHVALHAYLVSFHHPVSLKQVSVSSNLSNNSINASISNRWLYPALHL